MQRATDSLAERPFVLLSQPTLFDPTRAPEGKHIAWAYCHVPNGSRFDMLDRLESQIERFAPGFRDCVLARRVFSPAALQAMDANLIGGDIAGGASTLKQFIFRPTWRTYATSAPDMYLVLGLDAARSGRSRHVRLQCSQACAVETAMSYGNEPVWSAKPSRNTACCVRSVTAAWRRSTKPKTRCWAATSR